MATENSKDAGAKASAAGTSELSLLDKIVLEGKMAIEPSQGEYAKKMLGQFATQILDEGMKTAPNKGVVAMINERVAEIDRILSDQLNAIMHHEQFQALEASWVGLHDMVFGSETSTSL
uniref:type VI secretion system contractile sheath domain-containing protein n=1 Tax=Algoriphagus sp. TaxID=1872435 RepID=UPI0040487B68